MGASADRPLAVVTGASTGIGYELAKLLAEKGFDLLITAENPELAEAKRTLAQTGASISSVKADLTKPGGVQRVHKAIERTGRPVEALVLNAGIGAGGQFAGNGKTTDLEQELSIVDLNCRSTVHLAKLVLPEMVEHGHGRLLFTSSIASAMPGAFTAVYNASKSFVQSFALALRNELKETEITVTSLMPGPTETEFFERARMKDTKVGASDKDDPAEVARQGFEAMMTGKERVVAASLSNKLRGWGSRLMPDRLKAEQHRKMAEPGTAAKA